MKLLSNGKAEFKTPTIGGKNSTLNHSSRVVNTLSNVKGSQRKQSSLTPEQEKKLSELITIQNQANAKLSESVEQSNQASMGNNSRPPLGSSINKLVQNREQLLLNQNR